MARTKAHTGTIYKKAGNSRLYLSIPPAVARVLDVPRSVATGLPDTPQNRIRARDLLIEITERYHKERNEARRITPGAVADSPAGAMHGARRRVGRDTVSIRAAFELFKAQYAPNRSHSSQRNYILAYNAVMSHGDEGRLISELDETGASYLETVLRLFITSGRRMGGEELRSSSVEDYVRTFLIFLTWASSEGMMPVAVRRKRIRSYMKPVEGKEIKIYTDTEINALIAAGRSSPRVALQRMAGLVEILSRTPLRLHEAMEMTPAWIDRHTLTLRVPRKDGRTTDYVPVRMTDVEVIDAVRARTGAGIADPVLGYSRASDSRLRRTLYDLMDAAGVERDGRSFHEFKKTYISRLVAEVGTKMSLFEVARLARCSEQVLTRHYLKLGTNRLRDLMTQVWDASALAQ